MHVSVHRDFNLLVECELTLVGGVGRFVSIAI